jgi:hypothetical protein
MNQSMVFSELAVFEQAPWHVLTSGRQLLCICACQVSIAREAGRCKGQQPAILLNQ